MKVLEEEHFFYILEQDEQTNEYFLEAVCGTVAAFTLKIKLTPQEIVEYQKNPASVRFLAQQIVDSPSSFLSRRV